MSLNHHLYCNDIIMANKNVLGKKVNWSQFKSLMAGIALLVSSWLLNTLQAQEVVTKKQLIKKEQKANEKLDPLFEAPFAYLYGTGLQEHINKLIANQHLNKDNLSPAFLNEEVLKILEWQNKEKKLEPVETEKQIIEAVQDSLMQLLVIEYAKVSQIYISHIKNVKENIVVQKNWSDPEWADPYNRVALPREVRIEILVKLFWEKKLFGTNGTLGNTKQGREFAAKLTDELESEMTETLKYFIAKFKEYRRSDTAIGDNTIPREDAIFKAANDASNFGWDWWTETAGKQNYSITKGMKDRVEELCTEAIDEIFKEPTTKK